MNTYSGINTRSVAETDKVTFRFDFTCDSNSGIAALGFSGENKNTAFSLVSGRLYDPEGRYVFSYNSNQTQQLSGQISGANYDYYLNREPVCFIGKKEDYKIQKFFINTTGCNVVSDVEIFAPEYNYKSNYQTGIYLEEPITGKIEAVDPSRKFQIFSGKVVTPTGITFSGFEGGLVSDSILTFNVTSGAREYETYFVTADIYTNFGVLREKFSTKIVPKYSHSSYFSITDASSTRGMLSGKSSIFSKDVSGIGITQTGDWHVLYDTYANQEILKYKDPKEIKISFDYVTGNTGSYYVVTGFDVVSGGSNYSYPASLTLTQNESGHTSVTGRGVARLAYSVTGLNLNYAGTGYTGVPEITFSGGGGTGVYAEAFTGISGSVTGLNLLSGGSGYFTTPLVFFDKGDTGSWFENATGLAALGSGYIYSCFPVENGAYLDYQPSVSVSGGSGEGAYVTPLFSGYEKSIISLFDLQTGLLLSGGVVPGFMSSYSYLSHYTGNTGFYNPEISYVPYEGEVAVRILKSNFHDVDEVIGRVSISGMYESYAFFNVTGKRISRS